MLKGFDFGLDLGLGHLREFYKRFPSLKGFDFGLDWRKVTSPDM